MFRSRKYTLSLFIVLTIIHNNALGTVATLLRLYNSGKKICKEHPILTAGAAIGGAAYLGHLGYQWHQNYRERKLIEAKEKCNEDRDVFLIEKEKSVSEKKDALQDIVRNKQGLGFEKALNELRELLNTGFPKQESFWINFGHSDKNETCKKQTYYFLQNMLIEGAQRGQIHVVKSLLDNIICKDFYEQSSASKAFFTACAYHHFEVAKILLNDNIDCRVLDNIVPKNYYLSRSMLIFFLTQKSNAQLKNLNIRYLAEQTNPDNVHSILQSLPACDISYQYASSLLEIYHENIAPLIFSALHQWQVTKELYHRCCKIEFEHYVKSKNEQDLECIIQCLKDPSVQDVTNKYRAFMYFAFTHIVFGAVKTADECASILKKLEGAGITVNDTIAQGYQTRLGNLILKYIDESLIAAVTHELFERGFDPIGVPYNPQSTAICTIINDRAYQTTLDKHCTELSLRAVVLKTNNEMVEKLHSYANTLNQIPSEHTITHDNGYCLSLSLVKESKDQARMRALCASSIDDCVRFAQYINSMFNNNWGLDANNIPRVDCLLRELLKYSQVLKRRLSQISCEQQSALRSLPDTVLDCITQYCAFSPSDETLPQNVLDAIHGGEFVDKKKPTEYFVPMKPDVREKILLDYMWAGGNINLIASYIQTKCPEALGFFESLDYRGDLFYLKEYHARFNNNKQSLSK